MKTRNWGKVLNKYVYDNLAGETVIVFDEEGNEEVTSFAKKNERINKNNSTNNRKVIDKLARKQGLHEQLAVAHAIELISVSERENRFSSDNTHQWLDDNGKNDWEYWTTYIQDKNNTIWEATLNIANTSNGEKILYDIYPIKKAGQSVKSDTSSANSILPQNSKKSSGNAKYSLSPAELDKQYLQAVKNNDIETAQKIVDDVAKENGYTIKAYHGTLGRIEKQFKYFTAQAKVK